MIPLIFYVLIFTVDVWTDTAHWSKVNHYRGMVLRVAAVAMAAVFDWRLVLLTFTYWALFDTLTGLIKGYRWPLVGTTAKLDTLQRRYAWLIAVKYAGGAAGIYFYLSL